MAAPVIIPAQNVPPMDPGSPLFAKAWYLALNSMVAALAANSSAGGGGLSAPGYYVVPVLGSGPWTATPNLSNGANQEVILVDPLIEIKAPLSAVTSNAWTLFVVQDAVGGRVVSFDTGYAGNLALPGMLVTDLSTYSALLFVMRPDGKAALNAITTGMPVT